MSNKTLNNTLWIIGCRIARALLNLLVSMLTARYLGPSNFGLINYAASLVAFVTPFMQLGFSTILVQELVTRKEEQGKTLGTVIMLNFLSSLLCIVGVGAFAAIANPGERDTLLVCVLYSLNLPIQALEMIQYWYQAELKAKYTSLTGLLAYILVSAYKIYLLITGKSVYWYAVSQALDYLIIALALLALYPKLGGQKLGFSWKSGREMFAKSKYYILSAMMITVFAQTDKIMLKMMVGEEAVGYYATAVACAGMTGFAFTAIIDTARPIILQGKQHSQAQFEKGVVLLYTVIIYLALAQSVVITLFCEPIIRILYGKAYIPAVPALRILVWYTIFSYMGAVRTVWVLGEEKHTLLWKVNLCGALANVALNYVLIPVWGAEGAAAASLVTQFFTNVLIGFILPDLRRHNQLIITSLYPVRLICDLSKNRRK